MNCPTHGTPLTRIGPDSYACHRCRVPWIIYMDPSASFRFDRRAPFASLVLEIDRITGASVRHPSSRARVAVGEVA